MDFLLIQSQVTETESKAKHGASKRCKTAKVVAYQLEPAACSGKRHKEVLRKL